MTMEGELRELWHVVEARRDDGTPTMFRIRELEPQKQLTKIFVVELPYPKTELSRLPNAADYRRLGELEEQWLRPACAALGWEVVGHKIEDGSFFLYMYGAGDPNAMIERLSPFDASLGFYDDDDPDWQEYGTLRDLLDQAKAIPATDASKRQRTTTTAIKNKPAAAPSANGAANGEPTAKGETIAKAAKRATSAKTAAKATKRTASAKAAAKATKRAASAKTAAKARPAKSTKAAKPTRATQAARDRRKAKPAARTATKRKRR